MRIFWGAICILFFSAGISETYAGLPLRMRFLNRLPVPKSVMRKMMKYGGERFEGTAVPMFSKYMNIAIPLDREVDPRVTAWFDKAIATFGNERGENLVRRLWSYTEETVAGAMKAGVRQSRYYETVIAKNLGDFIQPRYEFQNAARHLREAREGAFRVLLEGTQTPYIGALDRTYILADDAQIIFEAELNGARFSVNKFHGLSAANSSALVRSGDIVHAMEGANQIKMSGLGAHLQPLSPIEIAQYYRIEGMRGVGSLFHQILNGY